MALSFIHSTKHLSDTYSCVRQSFFYFRCLGYNMNMTVPLLSATLLNAASKTPEIHVKIQILRPKIRTQTGVRLFKIGVNFSKLWSFNNKPDLGTVAQVIHHLEKIKYVLQIGGMWWVPKKEISWKPRAV